MLELYNKYHLEKHYTLIGLFRKIKRIYNPKKILYPGCYSHITPSLIFQDVTYIDSSKKLNKFFNSNELKKYIEKNKEYKRKPIIKFINQDYSKKLRLDIESFDLIISQYGGLISKATKKYLKSNGILVCNDSHGDASFASLDKDFELIAVYIKKSDNKFTITKKNLKEYLIPKKTFSKKQIIKTMKGIVFTKIPTGYIFRKKL